MIKSINTQRLTLREYTLSDAKRVQELAGDSKVSELTANIPYPYKDGMAESWINSHRQAVSEGKAVIFAITLKDSGELIGTVGLTQITDNFANLGYWLGADYWNKGYCSEAVNALTTSFFKHSNHPEISAQHITENFASGQVLTKCGFQCTGDSTLSVNGTMRQVKMYVLPN
ncbi:GNAT family N-acetyltransferase [Parendozoicomonas haliclonae]|uniref:N-acetyltransferase domain-containing protein n=1 Tax=Parendozoicomonas haliclonae TaxID=1960125 RepID=A0A1X7AK92_9GAMM|nr:GNAT family N-acetyltransferase [Parendozoicomonas haliclonae]SMA47109.1 hypothetical protein EHSB41UT_02313 [Parendozoicomonas haliclonae]